MRIVTASQMQELDRRTIEEAGIPGATLMERAGTGVVSAFEDTFGSPKGRTICIFCGKGNNGGDGWVVARLMRRKQAKVKTLLLGSVSDLRGDAKTMYRRFVKLAGAKAVVTNPTAASVQKALSQSDYVVDALLGTGISSTVKATYQEVIQAINDAKRPVIAVDLPSGIHTDTGVILGTAIRADLTVTFGYPKLGLYLGQGIDCSGSVRVTDIGIPSQFIDDLPGDISLLTASEMRALLPPRPASAHKGTFGHAGIIAGSPGKTGAAALAAKAALRTGVGLVTVAIPSRANPVLESKLLEAMTFPVLDTESGTFGLQALPQIREFASLRDSIAIGPGLTTHPETTQFVQMFMKDLDRPSVIDADGLNALAGHCEVFKACKGQLIVTPHPGEMSRLVGHASPRAVNEHRVSVASDFAKAHGVVVVLKGARTVVAHPGGAVTICPTGNPGMASAGMGDVLTGMLAGFLAQGLVPWDAARLGVYLHGWAGDLAAATRGQAGLIAGDLIDQLPQAIMALQQTTE